MIMKEVWKPVPGYEDRYLVSDLGNVKSIKRNMLLKGNTNRDGYTSVILSKNGIIKAFRVHRLVAEVFVPNPDGKTEVNHKDYNRSNNVAGNLEWMTRAENFNYSLCNKMKRDAIICPTNTGEHHISFHKGTHKYSVQYRENGKRRQKYFYNLNEAIDFRNTIYKQVNAGGKTKIVFA